MRQGADEIKEQVDLDNISGFPIINFGVLLFIALILYLIWDKLNEKMDPVSTKKGVSSSTLTGVDAGYFGNSKSHKF